MISHLKLLLKGVIPPTIGALLILGLLQPFGISRLELGGRLFYVLFEASLALFTASISWFVLEKLFHIDFSQRRSKYSPYLDSLLIYLINLPLLAFVLTVFDSWYVVGHVELAMFWNFMLYVGIISVFLFAFTVYQIRSALLKQELDEIRAINALLEERQERLSQESEQTQGQKEPPVEEVKCKLTGTYGNISLEVLPTDIIYVESMANYTDICYLENGETKHKTLRLTLKSIKESLGETDFLVQCHRAFIVNLNFVISLSKQDSGYSLQLFGNEKAIPVSRANTAAMKEKLK